VSYDNTNTGTLFKNDMTGKSENFPPYGGKIDVDGKEYWVSAWVKDGKSGKFFSLAIKPKEAKAAQAEGPRGGGGGGGREEQQTPDDFDAIPF
jgi:hypothetical protein